MPKNLNLLLIILLSASCATSDPLTDYMATFQNDKIKSHLERFPESVNQKDEHVQAYPLETAISLINIKQEIDTFKLLLDYGARFDVVTLEEGKPVSAMELVAKKHNIEAMQALIDKGEDRRSALAFHNALKCDRSFSSVMEIKAFYEYKVKYNRDDLGIIKWMLNNGWDVNAKLEDGTTPVMTALENCSIDFVKYLFSKGAKLNEKNDKGFDALYFAVRSENPEALKFLLKKGFKVKDKKYGKTEDNLLHVVLSNNRSYVQSTNPSRTAKLRAEYMKMIEILVKEGVDINAKQKVYLYTPLAWAAMMAGDSYVQKLIELGAEINPINQDGETPLDLTNKPPYRDTRGHKIAAQLLINAGGVYRRYRPQKAVAKKKEDNSAWAVLGGLGASAIGFKSGLSEAASIDVGTRMARNIKDDNVTIDNFKANQALMPKKVPAKSSSSSSQQPTATNSKMKVANKDFNVDKKARAQFSGTYSNTHFDRSVADSRYVLNSDGSAKLFTRACETCTHDLQGGSMSRDWKEKYQAIEWAPMLDDKNNPLVVQIKDMYDKSYQARILLVILQGGKTMTLKHYTDSKGAALLGSYGVALYKN